MASSSAEAVSDARTGTAPAQLASSSERKPTPSSAASGSSPSPQQVPIASASKSNEKEQPNSPTSAGSRLWSSWISPSSSASAAASSAFEARRKRRPTFEEFRAEEPPQARLIRLRGLFDVLLDKDDEQALAGGRAKEEWTRRAMQARYGAGGAFARGSLAPPNSQGSTAFGMAPEDRVAAGVAASTTSAQTSGSATLPRSTKDVSPGLLIPPCQSYAKELLSQCRECRAELERERQREAAREDGNNSFSWTSWLPWSGASEPEPETVPAGITSKLADLLSLSGSNSKDDEKISAEAKRKVEETTASSGSLLNSISSIFSTGDSSSSSPDLGSDHEGEAGWVGSGVWGLSAVGATQRQADRERDNRVAIGEEVEDDGGRRQRQIEWEGFLRYAETKERELYKIFSELDKNGDMHLDVSEIRTALDRAGIEIPDPALADFVASIASSSRHQGPGPAWISFPQFRDYLLLLPRKPSVNEIYRFYQVRKAFGLFGAKGIFASFSEHWGRSERHGATAVNLDGDVSLAGEERKKNVSTSKPAVSEEERERKAAASASGFTSPSQDTSATASSSSSTTFSSPQASQRLDREEEDDEEEEDDSDMIHGAVAVKFLLAGGIAGAVSRTATAPFDRLKIYLITTARQSATSEALTKGLGTKNSVDATAKLATKGASMMGEAIRAIYRDGGGVKAFWLGNGLNCVKIFPESAIKFLSYEMSKRAFAKYVDNVSDSRDISGTSRFISGGIGGITSQLAIYPVETLKTRLMSSQGSGKAVAGVARLEGNALVLATARDMWRNGGLRTYYRGLTAGLIGVFPYSAIDMSTFEGIKLFWIKYTGREEPSVLSLLAFGSISGSVGATTVYPLNLVRTRLQAAGTPAHPQTYDGFADVVRATYKSEGVSGFYRGLVPTLAKVVPAVSISYVVYEHSKRHLGVQ